MTFSEELLEYQNQLKLSVLRLSEVCEVRPWNIRRWLAGVTVPNVWVQKTVLVLLKRYAKRYAKSKQSA